MIDIHAHILPGLDDGPSTIEESLALAKETVKNGITGMIATPHHANGSYINPNNTIKQAVDDYNMNLLEAGIPLTVYTGQEIRIASDLKSRIQKDLLPLGPTNKYFLIELDAHFITNFVKHTFFELQLSGFTPIIAHPERNSKILANPNILYELVNEGALAQITCGSIVGDFGTETQKLTERLIEHQLVHFLASDCHDMLHRAPLLDKGLHQVQRKFGKEAEQMFIDNGMAVISGSYIKKSVPQYIEKRGILQKLFF